MKSQPSTEKYFPVGDLRNNATQKALAKQGWIEESGVATIEFETGGFP
jgi:hypothetical protein